MRHDHDHSYKQLFSHPRMVQDLIQGFVREEWTKELDFSSLEKVSGSYVTDDLRDREDDIIWRLKGGDGWLYVYLLLEFQSTVDRYMAIRVMAYVALLYQDLIKGKQTLSDGRLPPVFPVVLYNGKARWNAAEEVADLIVSVPGGLKAYKPRFRYLLLDEGKYTEIDLPAKRNLAAALFSLENSRRPADIQRVVSSLVEWLQAPEQTSLRRAFTVWLRRVLLPARFKGVEIPPITELQEVKTMLAERVKEWTMEWKEEGLQEGVQQGVQQGLQQGLQEGLQQGLRQGLESERRMLGRLVKRRYGSGMLQTVSPLLGEIRELNLLEIAGEWVIEYDDGQVFFEKLKEASGK